jgi:hypothetical protein
MAVGDLYINLCKNMYYFKCETYFFGVCKVFSNI